MTLFAPPVLDIEDSAVIDEVHAMREQLRHMLATPRRWQGGLRRTLFARAIRGSNSIEGYHVSVEDAVAAVDDAQPLGTDETTWHEVVGYRHAMGYVLRLGQDPDFVHQPSVLRGMHYMLLSHDLSKSPGHYRQGPIFVQDAGSGRQVYEGPDHELVPDLVDELCAGMEQSQGDDVLVTAAMAHLNLVMIHPFRDGNGRMARALQTLVLARGSIVAPEFASIEEWLGRNTQDYYRVLAWTGNGSWNPLRDTHLWVKFNLRAHHMQTQTVRWRTDFARALWHRLEEVADGHGLPDRTVHALYDAATSIRFRRPTYVALADVEPRTATRDLAQMVGAGLLEGRGATRARVYSAGEPLRRIAAEVAGGQPSIADPYPSLMGELAARAGRPDQRLVTRTTHRDGMAAHG